MLHCHPPKHPSFLLPQVYYDLLKERRDLGLEDKIAIHTIEQISPFPFDIMKKVSDTYCNAELCFVQVILVLVLWRPLLLTPLTPGGAQEHGLLVIRAAQDPDCYWGLPQAHPVHRYCTPAQLHYYTAAQLNS